MTSNKDISVWLSDNLSDILSFPVPSDLIEYILTIENDRDIEDYLKTLLNLNDPRHKAFVEKYKIIKHAGENKEKNEKLKLSKGEGKKKQKNNESFMDDGRINDENEEAEPQKGAKPKKNKFINLYSSEGEKKDVIFLKGRHLCECQASKHKLINNCLKCGRIVCAQEGSGPCFFCGTLVCSEDEQNILNANNKKSKKLYDALMSSAVSDELETALAQRNRLLEYDRTVQQRSKIIDDESDYYSTSSWLTKEERDKLQKKEEEAHARKHASRLEKKVTLDFAGRRVIEEVEDEKENEKFEEEALNKIKDTLAESHAHPDFPPFIQPIFISEKDPEENPPLESKHFSTKRINYKIQDKELLLISDNGACLSLHQPWASLLVCGIKKHEGRTWYTSHRGRLWIAAASKAPTEDSIKECENFYRAFTEDENIKFPPAYPTSCLLGCVSLVDCLPQEEYRAKYPNGESESPFVFICEEPQELDVRFPMSGSHKIYKLDGRIHQAAKKALLRMAKQMKNENFKTSSSAL